MFDPSISKPEGAENNYMLASIIGKRAVQITKGSDQLTDCDSENTVSIAISEYKQDKITYISNEKIAKI